MKNKLIIKKEPFSVSDEELAEFMDFQGVIKNYHQAKIHRAFPAKSLAGLLILLTLAALMLLIREHNPDGQMETEPAGITSDSVQKKLSPAPFPEPEDSLRLLAVTPEDMPEEQNTRLADEPVSDQAEARQEAESQSIEQSRAEKEKDEVIFLKAEPQGGVSELYRYFEENLKYPRDVADSSVTGQTLVTFTIFKDGSTGDYRFETTLGEPFEKEALRVLKNMPPWDPATVNGKPVDSKISIPLYFTKP